ncbi:hypothetical protein AA14337_3045 [Acetobacter malorum DSM 14337]|uniref:Uncharacterized protein n=2 Tax=Acetobacter malorum TaxID=178901 RepID=A0ABQ0PZA2_9PROT|nr:hypothetical protein AD930_10885 [Acetobacter malorum]GBQ85332.1 hypothetical protein AA14337_3045 [Acetobacter malorum DSM 14337]
MHHKRSAPVRKASLAILVTGVLGVLGSHSAVAIPAAVAPQGPVSGGQISEAVPFATARPNAGVPFGSMMTAEGKNGRTVAAPPPDLPLASEPMSQEDGRVQATFDRMNDQISDRLKGLAIGNGNLKPAKITNKEAGIVDQLSDEEVQIKLLDARNRHLAAAIKAWSTAYDPHKEQIAANEKIEQKGKDGTKSATGNSSGATERGTSNSEMEQLREEIESMKAQSQKADPPQKPPQDPYPVVTETSADFNGRMTADILVPYEGALDNVGVGDVVQEGVTIASISEKVVTVKDARTGHIVPLSWGNQVPKTRPKVEDEKPASKDGRSTGNQQSSARRAGPVFNFTPPKMPPPPVSAPALQR